MSGEVAGGSSGAEDPQPEEFAPAWDPLWDVFEPYDRHTEPQPDYGDFWPEPDDEEV